MRKYLLILSMLLLPLSAFATEEWREDGTENTILSTENASDIGTITNENIVVPLDRLLAKYRQGATIKYNDASSLTITAGSVACENSDASGHKMRKNTSSTAVTWSNLDTGSEASSTTYYVYATADTAVSTFSIVLSTNSSAPTGSTFYLKLGSFYNNSSSNITLIKNDDFKKFGTWTSRSNGAIYQAPSDGIAIGYGVAGTATVIGYTDSSSSPSTARGRDNGDDACVTIPVREGDYWKITGADAAVYVIYYE